jgi:hypothetical protein
LAALAYFTFNMAQDYLYIPLGGNRKGETRQIINLLITFLLSGLWHGAAWHFVAWGMLHGVFQVIGRSTAPFRNTLCRKIGLPEESRLRKVLQVCVTFTLVCFAWVFFRADTIADAFLITAKLVKLPAELAGYVMELPRLGIVKMARTVMQGQGVPGFGLAKLGLSLVSISVLLINDVLTRKTPEETILNQKAPVLRWAGYCVLILAILLNWNAGSSQFIYFEF